MENLNKVKRVMIVEIESIVKQVTESLGNTYTQFREFQQNPRISSLLGQMCRKHFWQRFSALYRVL